MRFIKKPYLPEGRIVLSVSSRKAEGRVVSPFRCGSLPPALQNHADLSFAYLGGGVAVAAPEAFEYYSSAFAGDGLVLIKGGKKLDMHYPLDCAYNVLPLGESLFCLESAADGVLLEAARGMGYEIVDIKQGYAKCSVCPIREDAAISADVSFIRAARRRGIDVLQITNDTVVLPGYKNGFFGGGAYMADEHTLVIAGDVGLHPDGARIREFAAKYSIEVVCDRNGRVTDFGSLCAVMCE